MHDLPTELGNIFTKPALTRREFLGGGLVAAAALTVASPLLTVASPAPAARTDSVPLYAVVHDERFAASRAFAEQARRQGASVKAIRGKVHDLWHDDLYHHWNDQPMALAGITTHDVLFLLAMMGHDAGMRVVYRAHHSIEPTTGEAQHIAFGPTEALARHPALDGDQGLWGRTAARIVTAWPKTAVTIRQSHSTIDQAHRHAIDGNALVTWLMVPASLRA